MTTKPFFNRAVATALILGTLGGGTSVGNAADGPTDAQIVGIVLAANQIDIDYGKLALAKSRNKQVREFAQRMITDHSAVQQSVREIAAKLGVRAADSPTSEGLKKGASEIAARLKALEDQEFDQLYVDNEVSYHEVVTGAVDTVLIPNARNPELKSALQGAQPLFLTHLEHVRQVQASRNSMMSHGE